MGVSCIYDKYVYMESFSTELLGVFLCTVALCFDFSLWPEFVRLIRNVLRRTLRKYESFLNNQHRE